MIRYMLIWCFIGLVGFKVNAQTRDQECREEFLRIVGFELRPTDDACKRLAQDLQLKFDERRQNPEPTPRDLQTKKSNTPGSVAALNQSEAIPALYPFALAGGSVGGAGTEGGANALTTLSLNPALFFTDMDDANASAKWGRLMDLSVILPLSELSAANSNLSYAGVRGRINITGVEEGSELFQKVLNEFDKVVINAAREAMIIEDMLLTADDCKACVAQFQQVIEGVSPLSSLAESCGQAFRTEEGDDVYSLYKEVSDKMVEEADKKYFGLDLRGDFGDPTLGAIDSASGTSLFLGIGYGVSKQNELQNERNLNFRLGVRYKDMRDFESTLFDIDGALGFEFARPFQFQQIKFAFGVEFRKSFEENTAIPVSDELEEAFETDYLFGRVSVNVPITASNSFSFQFGKAFAGDKPTVLSVNFNWKLLLED